VKYEPGVSVSGSGRFGVNGFNIRGMDESRVKVIVDGVEQPASYNPGADVMRFNQNMYETDTLAAIEINKGPASSLYGSDALGGAVIMRTKTPEDLLNPGDDTYFGFKSGYKSADESFKQTFTLANRSGDWESLLMYTRVDGKETSTHSDGSDIYGKDRGQANPYDYGQNNFLGKLFYQVNDTNRIGITGEYFERDGEGRILSDEGYTIMPGYTYTNNYGYDNDKRKRIALEHEWLADNTAFDKLRWQASWQEIESDHDTLDHTGAKGNRNRQRAGTDTSYQFDAQFDKEVIFAASRHQFTYGFAGIKDNFSLDYADVNVDTGVSTPRNPEIPEADSTKWGVYVQDQAFLMNDALVVTGGLRYDSFEAKPKGDGSDPDNESDALTAKLGAVYHWNQNISTFAQFSQGFKAPTLKDLYYFYSTPGAGYAIEANPDLKPEESNSYELGLRTQNRLGNLELTGFYNDYKNFIEERVVDDNPLYPEGLYTKDNVGKAEIYGAEFKGMLYLDEAFNAPMGTYSRLSVAYAKGKNKDTNDDLDTVAPLTSVVGLGYDAPSEQWGSALDITLVAGKSGTDWSEDNKDNVDAPSYTLVDLTAYYRPMNNLTLRAGLFNAFDEKYWLYQDITGVTDQEGLDRKTQPGRNWGVNLNYDF
jgi:hemoglobin/transferrin/lactoferrin receptor protein